MYTLGGVLRPSVQCATVDDRRHLAEVGVHEFAGAQVRPGHARLFQVQLDLAMHAGEPERRVPLRHRSPSASRREPLPRPRPRRRSSPDLSHGGGRIEISIARSTPRSAATSVSGWAMVSFDDLDSESLGELSRLHGVRDRYVADQRADRHAASGEPPHSVPCRSGRGAFTRINVGSLRYRAALRTRWLADDLANGDREPRDHQDHSGHRQKELPLMALPPIAPLPWPIQANPSSTRMAETRTRGRRDHRDEHRRAKATQSTIPRP